MGKDSAISWTHHTFNPWMGCVEVSPACDNCYARTLVTGRMRLPVWGKSVERRVTSDAYWKQPLAWDRAAAEAGERHRVFCGSLCDIMEDRPELVSYRDALCDLVIPGTPNLDWLLLSKRPQNFRRFLPPSWLDEPLPNVWLMTTVESTDYLWRMAELQKTPAVVKGVSLEPLLGMIWLPNWFFMGGKQSWCVVGGESGSKARPMNSTWVRQLRDDCVGAGVPFHFKQWGEWVSVSEVAGSGEHHQFSDGSTVRRVGKKAAGRTLEGKVWDEFPEAKCR